MTSPEPVPFISTVSHLKPFWANYFFFRTILCLSHGAVRTRSAVAVLLSLVVQTGNNCAFVLVCWQVLWHKPAACLRSQMWKVMKSIIALWLILYSWTYCKHRIVSSGRVAELCEHCQRYSDGQTDNVPNVQYKKKQNRKCQIVWLLHSIYTQEIPQNWHI